MQYHSCVSVHTVCNNSFGTLPSFLLAWKPQKSTQHPQKWVVRHKNHQNPPSTSKVMPIAVIHMFKVVLYIVGFLISKSRNLAQINLENFEIENGCEISRFRDLAKGLTSYDRNYIVVNGVMLQKALICTDLKFRPFFRSYRWRPGPVRSTQSTSA